MAELGPPAEEINLEFARWQGDLLGGDWSLFGCRPHPIHEHAARRCVAIWALSDPAAPRSDECGR